MRRIDIFNLKKYLRFRGDNKLARVGHVNHVIANTIPAPENPSNDDILVYNSLTNEWEAEPQPPGVPGSNGAPGPAGPQGVAGPVGPAGLTWQGAWSSGGVYLIDDAVGYGGASWFCINPVGPSVTNPDVDPTSWALLAAQGSPGPAGPTGATGAISAFTYEIGEYVPSEGGVIFHRYLESGNENYLVVPIVDESNSQNWSNITSTLIGAPAQSTWDGESNSNAIVAQANHLSSAASLCLNSSTGVQTDWHLPSIDELSLLYQNRFHVHKSFSAIGGASNIASAGYWSSTEFGTGIAWNFTFANGYANLSGKNATAYVRAVRTFTL